MEKIKYLIEQEIEKLSDPQDNESRPKVEKALEELNESKL